MVHPLVDYSRVARQYGSVHLQYYQKYEQLICKSLMTLFTVCLTTEYISCLDRPV
jgi:hypothetical protein